MSFFSYAVIGHPISHTMSPFIHKRLFCLQNIKSSCDIRDVTDISKDIDRLRSLSGFNVTIPHKSSIIPYLDEIDETAKLCGSVNTVKSIRGKLYGYTTDGAGFLKALNSYGFSLSGDILVLGNGGAARAVLFEAAKKHLCKITLACREHSKKRVVELFNEVAEIHGISGDIMTYQELSDARRKFDLLINTTSVGMYPDVRVSPVGIDIIKGCRAVCDIIYNPDKTLLMEQALESGIPVAGGMEMLVFQAAEAHRIWYGGEFSVRDIKKLCKDAREELKKFFESGD